jgi:hypothetical protein
LVGGGDAATAVNIAATAGENAAENNFLFSKNLRELKKVTATCATSQSAGSCNRKDVLELRDKTLDVLQENFSKAGPAANMKQLIGSVSAVYQDEFDKYGVSANNFLLTMANIESTFNPTATNAAGYQGLYQFSSSNAMGEFRIGNPDPSIRLDPTWSAAAAAQFGLNNAAYLNSKGVSVTAESLYLAHQQGVSGAVALLQNPNSKASDVLTNLNPKLSTADAEKRIVQNGGNANMTSSDFVNMWSQKYDTKKNEAIK